jgi:chemotaxis receptor (MCP) glutamine deamidase CheD
MSDDLRARLQGGAHVVGDYQVELGERETAFVSTRTRRWRVAGP